MVRTRSLRSNSNLPKALPVKVEVKAEQEDVPVVSSPSAPSSPASIPDAAFTFKGNQYSTYQEMVKAKRNFNQEMLIKSGLLEASAELRYFKNVPSKKAAASQRGLRSDRKRQNSSAVPLHRRKSSRIAGEKAQNLFIENESGGRFVVGGATGDDASSLVHSEKVVVEVEEEGFYNNRVNDGSDLSIKEAVELGGHKWVKENSVNLAEQFVQETLGNINNSDVGNSRKTKKVAGKSNSNKSLASQVESWSVDDENCVAKVVPERIYSVAFHPSSHKLIATAGDKKGFVGLWDVDSPQSNDSGTNNGVHLFKPHSGAVNNLEWNRSGTNLLSLSYDGTIRLFDINNQCFTEAFACYDDSEEFKDKLGYGMEEDSRRFYTQYACYDHRNEDCLFLSTSMGGVAHIDMRNKKKTFDLVLGNKKINTVR